ncbi:PHP domain-containing protein [Tessaracoccus antarcticus]|uniref:PHP domain-containing protein n=1 Tax=Tessaracoccus antarcticus TaxID=2479848 RepID=A0A3M0GRZ0_9ACTN|nr:PHP domain-containing protein [Tessaracoccus antarcticus]RMB60056.1 PHP domain-containing protein [Tessaracoccus antarcticus]
MRIDLHTHSRVSDGTDTPTRLVLKALEAGLDVIALTDHDTFDGVLEAAEVGKRVGVRVVTGLEMSTEVAGHSVHLLGYGCDIHDEALTTELSALRRARAQRLPAMCQKLTDLGLALTVEEVEAASRSARALGRPHVADALVAKGYVTDRTEAFNKWLGVGMPAWVPRYNTDLARAITLVHGSGGAAVIAHPWARGNADVLTAPLLESLVLGYGLDGIEVDHEDHDADTRRLLFEMGGRLGLVRTGSSDYHGTGKRGHDLGCNLTRKSAFMELVSRIRARGGVV